MSDRDVSLIEGIGRIAGMGLALTAARHRSVLRDQACPAANPLNFESATDGSKPPATSAPFATSGVAPGRAHTGATR